MNKTILGQDVVLEGGLGFERPNDNQLIIGPSGSGKSMSVFWPTLLHICDNPNADDNCSFIGTFAKDSNVTKAVNFFKRRNYDTPICNLAYPEEGTVMPDPLHYVSSDDDITHMCKSIAYANPDYQRSNHFDPYWKDGNVCLLTALTYKVLMTEDNPTIIDILDLFDRLKIEENGKGITTSLDDEFDAISSVSPQSAAVRYFSAFRQLPYATAGCVRDDLDKAIHTMFPESLRKAIGVKDNIDFISLADKPTALFVVTSSINTTLYSFANMIFSLAIKQLLDYAHANSNHKLPRHVRLMFDDFSCGFPVVDYEKHIAIFREAGISSMMLIQSEAQLTQTYGEAGTTCILDNVSSIVFFPGGLNYATCKSVAARIDRPLDEVMYMKMGKVIIMTSGQKPRIVKRYNTLEDELYQEFLHGYKAGTEINTR